MNFRLPGAALVDRLGESSAPSSSASGEDPEIRTKMERMTGYLAEHGKGKIESNHARAIARNSALRADRRK